MLRFSIVIPNRNSGAVLERAIRSILDQRYPAVQLIVADCCSDDESAAVLERYAEHLDLLIRRRDRGQVDALNSAFRHATGDIYGWLCADDELLPGALEAVAAAFERDSQVEVVSGDCEHLYPDGTTRLIHVHADAWETMGVRNTLNQPSVFWRADLHRALGELDDSYQLAFDWEFWCRMRQRGARPATLRRVLSRYHFSAHNKTSVGGRMHVEEGFRIIRRHGPFDGWIAYVYRAFYRHFDLKGCMDSPPSCSPLRLEIYRATWRLLLPVVGLNWLRLYNWHFASLQERGRDWWNR